MSEFSGDFDPTNMPSPEQRILALSDEVFNLRNTLFVLRAGEENVRTRDQIYEERGELDRQLGVVSLTDVVESADELVSGFDMAATDTPLIEMVAGVEAAIDEEIASLSDEERVGIIEINKSGEFCLYAPDHEKADDIMWETKLTEVDGELIFVQRQIATTYDSKIRKDIDTYNKLPPENRRMKDLIEQEGYERYMMRIEGNLLEIKEVLERHIDEEGGTLPTSDQDNN